MSSTDPPTNGPHSRKSGDDEDVELEALSFGGPTARSGPFSSSSYSSSTEDVETEHEAFKTASGGLGAGDDAEDRPGNRGTLKKSVEARWMIALYWLMFLAGWSDASTGPLLLRIQTHYQLSYPVVSLIFVAAFVGFAVAAGVNIWAVEKWGFGKVVLFAAGFQTLAFTLQSTKPLFPLFLLSFIPNGLGMGLQDANANALITRLPSSSRKMSLMHATYGFGAFVTPLIGTQFAKEGMRTRWEGFYLCSVGVAVVDLGLLWGMFRGKREERLFEEQGYEPDQREGYVLADQDDDGDRDELLSGETGRTSQKDTPSQPLEAKGKLMKILSSPFVHVVALFTWIYVGVEVTIGGWAVAYLVQVRGAGEDAGYTSSGFFAGLTIGRVAQIWVSKRMSEQNAVLIYTGVSGVLVMIIWSIPSVAVNAVAYALTGLVLGPLYPIMMNATAASLDPEFAGGAIGYIAAFGQCGSALFPWITGALAGTYGVWALQPLLLGMISLMGILWVLVVRMSRDKWKSPHRF